MRPNCFLLLPPFYLKKLWKEAAPLETRLEDARKGPAVTIGASIAQIYYPKHIDNYSECVHSAMSGREIKGSALFPHQKKCVEMIRKASLSRQKMLFSIAAGFGRTAIIVVALKELLEGLRIKRALVICSRKAILEQFQLCFHENSLETEILRIKPELSSKSVRQSGDARILLSSLVAFKKGIARFPPNFFDIVFLDECQYLSKTDWENIRKLDTTSIGFTTIHPSLINSNMLSFFDLKKPTFSYGISLVELKELAEVFPGASYVSADLSNRGRWRFIRPRDIRGKRLAGVSTFASKELVQRNQKSVLAVGDIVLQNIFGFSKMAMITKKDVPAVASKNLFIIRSRKTSPEILFDYLQSETAGIAFKKQLENLAHGALVRHININEIKEVTIPVPYSQEHLTSFTGARKIRNASELRTNRNAIVHLRRAYEEYSKFEGRSHSATH